MSVKAAADKSYDTLKDALAEGKFPENVADTAVKLCHRLKEPVRVSVMGMPGSGKSAVVNLLLNQIVMPEGVQWPTTQFLKGEVTQAICTMADGASQVINGADPHAIAACDPMFVEVHMPLPALGRISVLEVVAPESAKDQQRAMHWAAKRSDIVILCSHEFTSIEQALWGSLPEGVKDHAFLLVTCADLLEQSGRHDQMMEELRFGAGHEFSKIMSIATTDAIAARRADGTVDKPLMKQSGGLTLISTILRHVDQGLRATVDQADLILHKFRDAEPNPELARHVETHATPRPITKPLPKDMAEDLAANEAQAAAKSPVVEVVSSQPVVQDNSAEPAVTRSEILSADAFVLRQQSRINAPAPAPAPEPEQAAPPAEAPKAEAPTMGRPVAPVRPKAPEAPRRSRPGFMPKAKTSKPIMVAKPETCDAYQSAISYLAKQGQTILAQIDEMTSDDLVETASSNIMWLSDHLDAVPVKDDPLLDKGRTRALDASELVQLMQFEQNENAGVEAVSLMVQLKRDMEAVVEMTKHHSHVKAA